MRDEFPLWGARRIAHRLKELGHTRVPAVSTTTEILRRHGRLRPRKDPEALQWMSMLTTKRLEPSDLPEFEGIPDLTILLERLQNGRPIERKRCAAILANRHGLRGSRICQFLNLSPAAYRRCLEVFAKGGWLCCSQVESIHTENLTMMPSNRRSLASFINHQVTLGSTGPPGRCASCRAS